MPPAQPCKADLTTRGVRAIDPTCMETIWDAKITGFGLRTRRSKDPSRWRWVFTYREGGRGGTQVRLSRPFAELTPDQARKWAERERGRKGTAEGERQRRLRASAERTKERQTPTVKQLWNEYWEAEGSMKKAAHSYEQLWRDHLSPAFASTKVPDLTPAMVERFKVSKKAIPGACNRALALLSRMLSLGVRWGYRKGCAPEHPVKGVTRYPERHSEFYFTREELERILAAADVDCSSPRNPKGAGQGSGQTINQGGGLIIRLLALTGARLSEATTAHWGQFEFLPEEQGGGALWTVESTNTKTARPITRYLHPDLARRLLEWKPTALALQRNAPVVDLGRRWWVFPQLANPAKPMRQIHHVWERILKRAGVRKGRVHDLRHTAATLALRATRSLPAVQAQLGHTTPLTTRRYAHLMREQMIETGAILGSIGGKCLNQG